ncbi:hypothetical protein [Flavobacterium sedimenticola]|uniref:AlgX/AlgJ SGNH hydrolase-like domain-containing protein n=1 Tax=Flavobacterium sedimenticola TaxID=3043286 RepID=A0ABT6XRK7_9FLAO|nr:hypothetical protein [Flavobacterium sedimenticola]MDI9257691.1 hypothetical protein [Flavobacterium sedimenticola]
MKKFLQSLLLFCAIGIVIGEIIVRVFSLSIDVHQFYLDKDHLIKNYPNQMGHMGPTHQWVINKYGEFGYEPQSLENLITVIGDSYIANTMNPPECHQANYLSQLGTGYNFYPSARAGASFIEMMEKAKSLESLHPKYQLLYVHHGDFIESVTEIKRNPFTVQLTLKTGEIKYAKPTSGKVKEAIYNFKFIYFLYRNYLFKLGNNDDATNNRVLLKGKKIDYNLINELLVETGKRYRIQNIVLVFSPDTDPKVIDMAGKNGFHYFQLQTDDYKSWQMPKDSHWSCYGHQEVAKQVAQYLQQQSESIP